MSETDAEMTVDALLAEQAELDRRLDEALRTFAEYEERMNHSWQTADAEQRQRLMVERGEVETSLGIVAIVDRLDRLRELIRSLRGH